MIVVVYAVALMLALVLKWKAGSFILKEKGYGIFVLWLSRLLTGALVVLIVVDVAPEKTMYAVGALILYWCCKVALEIKLYKNRIA